MNMTPVYETAKSLALQYLPRNLLHKVKKYHYLNKVKSVTIAEEPDLEILKYLVQPGDCVVDIGANIGVYTSFLSRLVSATGRVYSIEPVPATFDYLAYNIRGLNLGNVIIKQVAITDRECDVTMMLPKDAAGVTNFYQATIIPKGTKDNTETAVNVKGRTLDNVLSDDVGNIVFIKCDIEGHELKCLHGSTNVLNRSRPAWLMEVSGNPEKKGSNADAVFSFMQNHEYSTWVYHEGKIRPWVPEMVSVNYLFLTKQQVERLRRIDMINDQG